MTKPREARQSWPEIRTIEKAQSFVIGGEVWHVAIVIVIVIVFCYCYCYLYWGVGRSSPASEYKKLSCHPKSCTGRNHQCQSELFEWEKESDLGEIELMLLCPYPFIISLRLCWLTGLPLPRAVRLFCLFCLCTYRTQNLAHKTYGFE